MNRFALVFATALAALPASADPAPETPYAGFERREIKALSPERADELRQGRGMGLALAAELNGYPGPSHALELGDALRLTPAQRLAVEESFERMHRAARAIGEEIITSEAELDRLFAGGSPTALQVTLLTEAIAAAEGRLRAVHLNAHVEMAAILSPGQIADYRRLRGYAEAVPAGGHMHR